MCICACGQVSDCVPVAQSAVTRCTIVCPWVSLRAYSLGVGASQGVSVSSVCLATQGLGCPHGAPPALARPCPAPRLQGNPPRGGRGRGARLQAPTCPRPRAGPWRHAGAGRGSEREAGRGGAAAEQAGPGESPGGLRRGAEPHASGAPGRRHQQVSSSGDPAAEADASVAATAAATAVRAAAAAARSLSSKPLGGRALQKVAARHPIAVLFWSVHVPGVSTHPDSRRCSRATRSGGLPGGGGGMHGQNDCLLAFPLPVPQFSSLGSRLGRLGRKEAPGTWGAWSGRTGATAVWRVCLQTMGFGLARAPWWPVRSGRSVVPGSLGSPESRYKRVRVGGGTDDRPHPGRAPAGGGDRGRRRLRLPRAGAAPQQQPVIGPARAGRAGRAHVAAWGGL